MPPTLEQLSNRRRWATTRRQASPCVSAICLAVLPAALALVLVVVLDYMSRLCTVRFVRADWKTNTCVYRNDCYEPKGEIRRPVQNYKHASKCEPSFGVDPEDPGEEVSGATAFPLQFLVVAIVFCLLWVCGSFVCCIVPWYCCKIPEEPWAARWLRKRYERAKRVESELVEAYHAESQRVRDAAREAEVTRRLGLLSMMPERRAELMAAAARLEVHERDGRDAESERTRDAAGARSCGSHA
jgi:hypothetical protein